MQNSDATGSSFLRVWPAAAATAAYCKPQPLIDLCAIFRSTTGWMMEHWPNSSQPFTLIDMDPDYEGTRMPRVDAERLCAAFAKVYSWQGQEHRSSHPTRGRVRSPQSSILAELGSSTSRLPEVAFAARGVDEIDAPPRLTRTLESLLEFAAKYVGGTQALLWTLDASSENLELRADIGLGWSDKVDVLRRPLIEAAAEIAALSGQAVVGSCFEELVDIACPFPIDLTSSAACLPVSSSREIFGVIWVDGGSKDDWDEGELEMLEIVSGRIAAELECEQLRKQI